MTLQTMYAQHSALCPNSAIRRIAANAVTEALDTPVAPSPKIQRARMIYMVWDGRHYAMTRNRKHAFRLATKHAANVYEMSIAAYNDCSSWDVPTFRAVARHCSRIRETSRGHRVVYQPAQGDA